MTLTINVHLKVLILLVILTRFRVNSLISDKQNEQNIQLDKRQSLDVASLAQEPFMWCNENGHFTKGIEFELLQTIAKKENFRLLIRKQFNRFEDIRLDLSTILFILFALISLTFI